MSKSDEIRDVAFKCRLKIDTADNSCKLKLFSIAITGIEAYVTIQAYSEKKITCFFSYMKFLLVIDDIYWNALDIASSQ